MMRRLHQQEVGGVTFLVLKFGVTQSIGLITHIETEPIQILILTIIQLDSTFLIQMETLLRWSIFEETKISPLVKQDYIIEPMIFQSMK